MCVFLRIPCPECFHFTHSLTIYLHLYISLSVGWRRCRQKLLGTRVKAHATIAFVCLPFIKPSRMLDVECEQLINNCRKVWLPIPFIYMLVRAHTLTYETFPFFFVFDLSRYAFSWHPHIPLTSLTRVCTEWWKVFSFFPKEKWKLGKIGMLKELVWCEWMLCMCVVVHLILQGEFFQVFLFDRFGRENILNWN